MSFLWSLRNSGRFLAGALLALAISVQPTFAANYPLEITNIKPAGTGGFLSTHRIYRAYPGLEYNIRVAVIGGAYPYQFTLSNAPAGMTIDSRGTIVWANPQANATPTITVRDSEGTQISSSWTINVSATPFRFVDPVNGNDSAAGTAAAPWRTFAGIYSNGAVGQIIYLRAGTYTPANVPVLNADHSLGEEYILWEGTQRPVTWLAYPGDARPVFDFGYVGTGAPYNTGASVPRFKISGPNLYVDGITFRRSMTMAFQVNHGDQAGTTFRRNIFDTTGPGIDGGNSAFIMFVAAMGSNSLYTVVQDNEFANVRNGSANSALKLYTLTKPLFEDNLFHDFDAGAEGLAIKAAIVQYTVRRNRFYNVGQGIGGNMNWYSPADQTRGEILYNTVQSVGTSDALLMNQNGNAGETFIYRNTFVGRVRVLNTDSADGPFRFSFNVIVSDQSGSPSGSHVAHQSVTDPSRIVLSNNLVGYPADNIVDSQGLLTPAYATYAATHGSQMPTGNVPPPITPAAPSGLRIIT